MKISGLFLSNLMQIIKKSTDSSNVITTKTPCPVTPIL